MTGYTPYSVHTPGSPAGASSGGLFAGEFRPQPRQRRSTFDQLIDDRPNRQRSVVPRRLSPTGARTAQREAAKRAANAIRRAAGGGRGGRAATAIELALRVTGYWPEEVIPPELLPEEEWPWVPRSGWEAVGCSAYYGSDPIGWVHRATSAPVCASSASAFSTTGNATWAGHVAAVGSNNPNTGPGANTMIVRFRDVSGAFTRFYNSGGYRRTSAGSSNPPAEKVPTYGPTPEPIPERRQVSGPVGVPMRATLAFAPFTAPREIAIDLDYGPNPSVRVVPSPRPVPPGRSGINNTRIRTRKPPKRESKVAMSGDQKAWLKAAFWLLETVADVRDWWDIIMSGAPLSVQRASFREQVAWFADVFNWSNYNWSAVPEAVVTWFAQEWFYGKFVGRIEEGFSVAIGSSSHYGVGVGTRYLQDDPVGAFADWVFGD